MGESLFTEGSNIEEATGNDVEGISGAVGSTFGGARAALASHELGARSVDVDRLAHYFRMRSEMRTNISSWRKSPFLLTLFQGSVGSTSVMS
jgi:hypothetical protein